MENVYKIVKVMENRHDEYEKCNLTEISKYDRIIDKLFDETVDLGHELGYVWALVIEQLKYENKKNLLRFYKNILIKDKKGRTVSFEVVEDDDY